MKRRLAKASFALAAALVFVSAQAGATVTLSMDGVWWQSLTRGEKVVAVQAVITGISTGYALGHSNGWSDTLDIFKLTPTGADARKLGYGKPPHFSKSFGTYVDELDLWYEGHSKTSIGPSALLAWCFDDNPEFSASVCETLGSDADK